MPDPAGGTRRLAVLLVSAAVVANLAFVGLGSVFNYPDVLQEPGAQVLAAFRERSGTVSALFLLLALGAAMMAPVAVGVSRLVDHRWAPITRRLGVAAGVVQVIGLLRWPLAVPLLAEQAADPARSAQAVRAFDLLGTIGGTVIGETFGYLLTAAWTVLVAAVLTGRIIGRVLASVGVAAAGLILSGVLVPFGVPGADEANLIGYVLWSGWLIALAVTLWRLPSPTAARSGEAGALRLWCSSGRRPGWRR